MVFKSKIYISGPRMGTNNTANGIELKKQPKSKTDIKNKRSNNDKK